MFDPHSPCPQPDQYGTECQFTCAVASQFNAICESGFADSKGWHCNPEEPYLTPNPRGIDQFGCIFVDVNNTCSSTSEYAFNPMTGQCECNTPFAGIKTASNECGCGMWVDVNGWHVTEWPAYGPDCGLPCKIDLFGNHTACHSGRNGTGPYCLIDGWVLGDGFCTTPRCNAAGDIFFWDPVKQDCWCPPGNYGPWCYTACIDAPNVICTNDPLIEAQVCVDGSTSINGPNDLSLGCQFECPPGFWDQNCTNQCYDDVCRSPYQNGVGCTNGRSGMGCVCTDGGNAIGCLPPLAYQSGVFTFPSSLPGTQVVAMPIEFDRYILIVAKTPVYTFIGQVYIDPVPTGLVKVDLLTSNSTHPEGALIHMYNITDSDVTNNFVDIRPTAFSSWRRQSFAIRLDFGPGVHQIDTASTNEVTQSVYANTANGLVAIGANVNFYVGGVTIACMDGLSGPMCSDPTAVDCQFGVDDGYMATGLCTCAGNMTLITAHDGSQRCDCLPGRFGLDCQYVCPSSTLPLLQCYEGRTGSGPHCQSGASPIAGDGDYSQGCKYACPAPFFDAQCTSQCFDDTCTGPNALGIGCEFGQQGLGCLCGDNTSQDNGACKPNNMVSGARDTRTVMTMNPLTSDEMYEYKSITTVVWPDAPLQLTDVFIVLSRKASFRISYFEYDTVAIKGRLITRHQWQNKTFQLVATGFYATPEHPLVIEFEANEGERLVIQGQYPPPQSSIKSMYTNDTGVLTLIDNILPIAVFTNEVSCPEGLAGPACLIPVTANCEFGANTGMWGDGKCKCPVNMELDANNQCQCTAGRWGSLCENVCPVSPFSGTICDTGRTGTGVSCASSNMLLVPGRGCIACKNRLAWGETCQNMCNVTCARGPTTICNTGLTGQGCLCKSMAMKMDQATQTCSCIHDDAFGPLCQGRCNTTDCGPYATCVPGVKSTGCVLVPEAPPAWQPPAANATIMAQFDTFGNENTTMVMKFAMSIDQYQADPTAFEAKLIAEMRALYGDPNLQIVINSVSAGSLLVNVTIGLTAAQVFQQFDKDYQAGLVRLDANTFPFFQTTQQILVIGTTTSSNALETYCNVTSSKYELLAENTKQGFYLLDRLPSVTLYADITWGKYNDSGCIALNPKNYAGAPKCFYVIRYTCDRAYQAKYFTKATDTLGVVNGWKYGIGQLSYATFAVSTDSSTDVVFNAARRQSISNRGTINCIWEELRNSNAGWNGPNSNECNLNSMPLDVLIDPSTTVCLSGRNTGYPDVCQSKLNTINELVYLNTTRTPSWSRRVVGEYYNDDTLYQRYMNAWLPDWNATTPTEPMDECQRHNQHLRNIFPRRRYCQDMRKTYSHSETSMKLLFGTASNGLLFSVRAPIPSWQMYAQFYNTRQAFWGYVYNLFDNESPVDTQVWAHIEYFRMYNAETALASRITFLDAPEAPANFYWRDNRWNFYDCIGSMGNAYAFWDNDIGAPTCECMRWNVMNPNTGKCELGCDGPVFGIMCDTPITSANCPYKWNNATAFLRSPDCTAVCLPGHSPYNGVCTRNEDIPLYETVEMADTSTSNTLSTGAVVGIAVGTTAASALLTVGAVFVKLRFFV